MVRTSDNLNILLILFFSLRRERLDWNEFRVKILLEFPVIVVTPDLMKETQQSFLQGMFSNENENLKATDAIN